MKQKIYILGILTTAVIFMATVFKLNHWPGAGILMTIGMVSLVLVFLPLAFHNSFRAEENRKSRLLYFVAFLTCFVIFTAMLFKIMHWPYTGILLAIAIVFPYFVFLPVFIITTSKSSDYNINNTVAVLFLLTLNSVFSGLLALNVSKDRIDDSLNLAVNYNSVEIHLGELADGQSGSPVLLKIDKVLKVIDDYQHAILSSDGITETIWNSDPRQIIHPDSRNAIPVALDDNNDLYGGDSLNGALSELLETVEITPGYESLSKALPSILDIGEPDQAGTFPIGSMFKENYMAWTLIWLDAMETNLGLIKATL